MYFNVRIYNQVCKTCLFMQLMAVLLYIEGGVFQSVVSNFKESKYLLYHLQDDRKATSEKRACTHKQIALNKKKLVANNFPIDGAADTREFVRVVGKGPKCEGHVVLGIDCEMVDIIDDVDKKQVKKALARLTAVSESYEVLIDMVVKVPGKVVDYLTAYSGMTKEILDGAMHTLEDAQKALLSYMHPDTFLVGHSLENDLFALKMIHDKVIDTSIAFPNPNSKYKYGLKSLAKQFLDIDIQVRH
jgi:RNA exonuclease 1